MKLKVGEVVEFKNYEGLGFDETLSIPKDKFPKSGKVTKVTAPVEGVTFFMIEGSTCIFSEKSVEQVCDKEDDIHVGDEVLIKATVLEVKGDNILVPWISKDDVVEVLNHKEEYFIVKEDHYGMYIGVAGELVGSKDTAQVFTSRNEANEAAADMRLNAWEVINRDA